MNAVLRQLNAWRFREQLIRLAWGAARTLAVIGLVLAVACTVDWVLDRYSGSEGWRKTMRSTRIFAPSDPLSVGHTPLGLRVMMTLGQIALAAGLVYFLVVRPLLGTPEVDDLATRAERAFPDFDHRLVTAIQLNRATADTRGMSPALIAEVTREAGEIASRHDFASLIDYRRVAWAAAAFLPVALAWGAFFAANPALAATLVQRQLLLGGEIPHFPKLTNVTQPVWPTGSEVTVRFKVEGGDYDPNNSVGTLRIVPIAWREKKDEAGNVVFGPDGRPELVGELQPEEFYELTNEKDAAGNPTEFYSVKLPPASLDFSFQARLEAGRTEEPGEVAFEAPPQLARENSQNPPLTAEQVLPSYLGTKRGGDPYFRQNEGWTRGEVVDALPRSTIIVDARFNKPVQTARLIPIERTEGLQERELPAVTAAVMSEDRLTASFVFPTRRRLIGYRLELEDNRGFKNPTPIRRNIRMWEDRPPVVEFRPESTRNPDPKEFDGEGNPKDYEWDMALGPDGLVLVIYNARSEVGIREANIRYRVIPRGVQFDLYPEEYKRIQHPRDDPNNLVFDRFTLTRFEPDPAKPDLGPFVPDLGLFTYSFRGLPRISRNEVNVQFFPFPSPNPAREPGELEAGGRQNFRTSRLLKKVPELQSDGSVLMRTTQLEVGDTVEVYVEAFDKLSYLSFAGKKRGKFALPVLTGMDRETIAALPKDRDGNIDLKQLPPRPAGYTREAKRKIVVTEADAMTALRQRDEARTKLRDKLNQLAQDQTEVFKPKK